MLRPHDNGEAVLELIKTVSRIRTGSSILRSIWDDYLYFTINKIVRVESEISTVGL